MIGLLLVPVALDRDDFPLATYPMYSRERDDVVRLTTAVGLTTDGDDRRLGLDVVGDTDDPLLAVGELRAAVRRGEADRRCAEIAQRVASAQRLEDVVEVLVVAERHDVVEHVRTGDGFRDRTVRARCPVPGAVVATEPES